ncbi:XRN 5'-3' exonuclease protein, putative [Babesia caballi]|uniref:5'-3' exoribonuclease n=1 Tax=Babesia caballi TaxID=5871 RepID=A0AAV4LXC1_BABCB|nr:XRN 5'-3' exonuclease protein, putative [Babesia caballi]
MGVPTFYRWLCSRYPRVAQDVKDDLNERNVDMGDAEAFGLALLSPNPNGETDNLYVDMNGLIHPCCHPEGLEQPPSEEVMFQCIFDYLDRLFYLVRPRKLLFLAIDGVAPRAKMNQQRSRRFKSAAEAELEAEMHNKVAQEFSRRNVHVPPKETRWDSNVITPGTPFMHELSKRIVGFIEERRRLYDAWSRIHVIYSDANAPGEGEHKIMNFVRNQRHSAGHDPNTRHVLHGMDADLIMLGLATHEVNFYIIREVVTSINPARKTEADVRNAITAEQAKKQWAAGPKLRDDKSYRSMLRQHWKPLQFLRLPVLREYLSHQLHFPAGWSGRGGVIDFERCVDDLVLMCFFCGNDFLPHLPSVSIPGGSIDQMILLYQSLLPDLGDYLTNEGEINFPQLDRFVSFVARVEDQVFRTEQEFKQRQKARREQRELQQQGATHEPAEEPFAGPAPVEAMEEVPEPLSPSVMTFDLDTEFKRRCAELLKQHREIDDPVEPIDLSLNDPYLWKAAYYRQKFGLSDADDVWAHAAEVAAQYVKGMCWVLRYYYQGCASWSWYYPYHYAPFCSDLKFQGLEVAFDHGTPFTPFQQLMSVMPIRSAHCLPGELQQLMVDSGSPIADFYPTKFSEDPNGKRYKYQWIALLPFIDERKLLSLVRPIEATLPEEHQERNSVKKDLLFAGRGGTGALVGEVNELGDRCEFVSKSDDKHRSALLKGAVLPPRVLRIEDLMEEGRSRGFNCEAAKRMISNVLGRGPHGSGNPPGRDQEVLRNFGRDFHQTQNQYNPHQHPAGGASARRDAPHDASYPSRPWQDGSGHRQGDMRGAYQVPRSPRGAPPYAPSRDSYSGAHQHHDRAYAPHREPYQPNRPGHAGRDFSGEHGRRSVDSAGSRGSRDSYTPRYSSGEDGRASHPASPATHTPRFYGAAPRSTPGHSPVQSQKPPAVSPGGGAQRATPPPNYLAGHKLERPRNHAPPTGISEHPPPPPPPPPSLSRSTSLGPNKRPLEGLEPLPVPRRLSGTRPSPAWRGAQGTPRRAEERATTSGGGPDGSSQCKDE